MAPCPSPSMSSAHALSSCPDIPKAISDDPRIQALLKSNSPSLETERVSLLATLSESSNLLSVLKEKIEHIQQTLNVLLDGQEKVTENLRIAETLLHPTRSIPDDILRHIFSFCVREIYDILRKRVTFNSLDSQNPPWTLSQVCRSWRRVALSTPTLWRCLSLDFEQYREPESVHLHQFMPVLHLQRARQCQLTIRLTSSKDVSSHPSIPILLTSIPYWKHLHIRIPAKSQVVLWNYRPYLESLHYLRIGLPNDHAASTIQVFDLARSLRVLDIDSILCRLFCTPDGGNGLTSLVIQGPFVKHIFSFLCKTPNLESLKLHLETSKPFERLNTPIKMPKLTNLLISESGAVPSIAHFFESLELPTLSFLQFGLYNSNDSTVLVFPEILPHHLCCGIGELEVTAPKSKIDKSSLISLLTHITNMQHLTISAKIVGEGLLPALTRSGNNVVISPRLRTLDLRGSKRISDDEILLEMVESRMKGQEGNYGQEVGLEEVFLDDPLIFDDPLLVSRWQALQSNGLIVHDAD
ncbi:hypothetical protein EDD18DRAFT_1225078 [Armillaria luteobubalina]|uniref:F-box domain-containing protein n=1 Tax=Armillaria luteobubalina TaxID=153913 RepID=A0AA39NX80_9AGAR|nr:hypothetical protein EDD18DRAFT_1225078 [Armillaria luteobubalina]